MDKITLCAYAHKVDMQVAGRGRKKERKGRNHLPIFQGLPARKTALRPGENQVKNFPILGKIAGESIDPAPGRAYVRGDGLLS